MLKKYNILHLGDKQAVGYGYDGNQKETNIVEIKYT
jgi:hypothetical protein